MPTIENYTAIVWIIGETLANRFVWQSLFGELVSIGLLT